MNAPQVLFIDDEPSLCVAMRLLLERHGFSVRTALTMDAAVDEVKTTRFDAVVLDFWLYHQPMSRGGSGDQLYAELVALDAGLARRMIFVTGDPNESTRERMERTGAGYLLKPFEVGLLVSSLRNILQTEGARVAAPAASTSSSRFA